MNANGESVDSATKRMAKNTAMLYFRQILIMLVSLYTVRVVLNILGEEDYGIYNVVAGVVVLFSFFNTAMASGTQRYLNFYLGKNDLQTTNKVFSASIVIHIAIALIFIVAAETIGLWFTNTQLNIPENRHFAAMTVYQLTIITTVLSILRVPYNSVIIAYEKMDFFAFLSILEALLKLVIVFLLIVSPFDKLIFYSFLLAFVTALITLIYKIYCNRVFEISKYKKVNDYSFIKEILGFNGWSLLGATADVANYQGVNIVLNIYTSVTVNTAMGIASQVNNAIWSFVSNFQLAFQPQIIKSYAENNKKYFLDLVYRTSKISFLLLSFITIPFLINSELVLTLWLKQVPDYSLIFVKLIFLSTLVSAWNAPLCMAIQATGDIKKYQIIYSCFVFANIPFSILCLYKGFNPESVLIVRFVLSVIAMFWRIIYVGNRIDLSQKKFIFSVIVRSTVVFLLTYIGTYYFGLLLHNTVLYFFGTCIISVLLTVLLSLTIGFDKEELLYIKEFLKNKVSK